MGKLAGAYGGGSGGTYVRTQIKTTNIGEYQAYFLGVSDERWNETSSMYKCNLCKGAGTGPRGEAGACRSCKGTGDRTDTKTKLIYKLQNGNVEEEVVNFKLTDGEMPSTMFERFRRIAGLPKSATAAEVDAWYSALPEPIKVPCRVEIGEGKNGDFIIEGVSPRQAPQAASARQSAPPTQAQRQSASVPEPADDDFTDIDSELPF